LGSVGGPRETVIAESMPLQNHNRKKYEKKKRQEGGPNGLCCDRKSQGRTGRRERRAHFRGNSTKFLSMQSRGQREGAKRKLAQTILGVYRRHHEVGGGNANQARKRKAFLHTSNWASIRFRKEQFRRKRVKRWKGGGPNFQSVRFHEGNESSGTGAFPEEE